MRAILLLAAVTATACVSNDTDSTQQRDEVDEPGDELDCECKIEGAQIGQIGVRVHAGDRTIVFEDWIPKVGEPGEYVGFVLSANAEDVSYVVKTGGELHDAAGTSWAHPDGYEGPEVPGISNVDFCDEDPPPDDEEDPVVN